MTGFIILIIAFFIELTVMTHRFLTITSPEKIRNILRIAALAVFSWFVLTEVIRWSFRWYGLAALLTFWAGIGLFRLWNPAGTEKEYRAGRGILQSASTMLLVVIAILPVLVFPEYEIPAPTGNFAVTSVQKTFVDEDRVEEYSGKGGNRKVNVECWYPEIADGNYPLVVFSHGGLATRTSNESLFNELASHGYVVCSIDHTYLSFWTNFDDGTVAWLSREYFMELQREDARTDKQRSFEYYQKWMSVRTGDIQFVLDTILESAASAENGMYNLIDTEKISVMGHSLGGSAALGIPRLRGDIDAVIALESPFLFDIVGVANEAFAFIDQAYPVPVLNVYSDSSWKHLSEWAQYERNKDFLFNPSEGVYSLHLPGAGHFSLTDLSLASPLLVDLLEGGKSGQDRGEYLKTVNQVCLEFLNRYLKNEKVHSLSSQ